MLHELFEKALNWPLWAVCLAVPSAITLTFVPVLAAEAIKSLP